MFSNGVTPGTNHTPRTGHPLRNSGPAQTGPFHFVSVCVCIVLFFDFILAFFFREREYEVGGVGAEDLGEVGGKKRV